MNDSRLRGRLLTRLFRDGQAAKTTNLFDLSRACKADLMRTLKALVALERAGLVDARRLRLTLSGLAMAAAFSESRDGAAPSQRQVGRSLPRARHAA